MTACDTHTQKPLRASDWGHSHKVEETGIASIVTAFWLLCLEQQLVRRGGGAVCSYRTGPRTNRQLVPRMRATEIIVRVCLVQPRNAKLRCLQYRALRTKQSRQGRSDKIRDCDLKPVRVIRLFELTKAAFQKPSCPICQPRMCTIPIGPQAHLRTRPLPMDTLPICRCCLCLHWVIFHK